MVKEYLPEIIFTVIDILVVLIVYTRIKKSTKNFELFKFKKMILGLALATVISYHLHLGGASIIFGLILVIYPIINILAYPQIFRNFLDDYQNRNVSKGNVDRLLSDDGLEAVAETIVRCYRQKLGSAIVITRKDYLKDIEDSGYDMGETTVITDLLELCFKPQSNLNKGALIIRDNKVVATNSKLPIVRNEQMGKSGAGNRHFGMFGVVTTSDAVVIGTSGDSGYITIGGTKPDGSAYFRFLVRMQEHDIQNGITKEEIKNTIKTLLSGVGNPEDYQLELQEEEEKERRLQERAQRKLDKAKNVKSKEQKMAERADKRRK